MESDLWQIYLSALPLLFKGCAITVYVSLIGILCGLFFGILVGVCDCQKLKQRYLTPFFRIYITLFRGTPLFVQLLIVYFALPDMLGIQLSPIAAGIITLGLNSTAYLAEIVRAGINSIDNGQWDACYILGYSKYKSMRYIILPQALRNVLPAITNELSTLIKESSILMVIGVPELVKVSKDIVARNLRPMEIYTLSAIFYLVMTYFLAYGAHYFEKRHRLEK